MEHARDIELVELASGRLDAGRAEALTNHLEVCPACRHKHEELRAMWEILGQWKVNPSDRPSAARRQAESDQKWPSRRARVIRLPGAGAVVRVAATIVFTALAGYASGHWSVRRDAGQSAGKTPPYLSVLALDVGESFSPLVLDNEFPAQEDG